MPKSKKKSKTKKYRKSSNKSININNLSKKRRKQIRCSLLGDCYLCDSQECPTKKIDDYQDFTIFKDTNIKSFIFLGCWGYGCYPDSPQEKVFKLAKKRQKYNEFMVLGGDNFYLGKMGVPEYHPSRTIRYKQAIKDNISCLSSIKLDKYVGVGNKEYEYNCKHLESLSNKTRTLTGSWKRWIFPHRFYGLVTQNTIIAFVDTILYAFFDKNKKPEDINHTCGLFLQNQNKNPKEINKLILEEIEAQESWLSRFLESNLVNQKTGKVRTSFVVGHHPIFCHYHKVKANSEGKKVIKELELIKQLNHRLLPIIMDNKVDAYLCAHEHNIQTNFIQEQKNDNQEGHTLKVLVIGGGGAKLDTKKVENKNYGQQNLKYNYILSDRTNAYGFMEITPDNLQRSLVQYVD